MPNERENDMIEAMCTADWKAWDGLRDGVRYDSWNRDEMRVRMRAAAQVLIDRVLGKPTALEFDAAINGTMREFDARYHPDGPLHAYAVARLLIRNRRAILDPPKPATLVERVNEILLSYDIARNEVAVAIAAEVEKK